MYLIKGGLVRLRGSGLQGWIGWRVRRHKFAFLVIKKAKQAYAGDIINFFVSLSVSISVSSHWSHSSIG